MKKIASYVLSAYSFVFNHSLDKLLDAGNLSKNGNPIPSFDEQLLIDLCSDAQIIFEKEPNLLEITGDVIIVGDLHGSLHDLLRIIHFIKENKSKVLFLGDYVDRGDYSLECVTILFSLKIIRPDDIYLIRGNHEFDSLCSQYGFKSDILAHHNRKKVKNKGVITKKQQGEDHFSEYEEYLADHNDIDCYNYTENLYCAFINAFSYMPIGAILNGSTFCIHGGLSPKIEHTDCIVKKIQRPILNFEDNEVLSDLVWGDPSDNLSCLYGENPRGRGYLFNRAAVMLFLMNNNFKRIVRAHECVKRGVHKHFNEKLVTVFSASSYDKNLGNSSAVLQLFQSDDKLEVHHFCPLERLPKCDAAYYKVQPFSVKTEKKIPSFYSFHHPFLLSHNAIKKIPHKKFNGIQPQSSHNSFVFHEMQSKMKVLRPNLSSNSTSLLPIFNENKTKSSGHSLTLKPMGNITPNDLLNDDQQS